MHALDSAWEALKRECDAACAQSARAARWEITNDVNQLLRRLRQYEGENDWFPIVVESLTRFVKRAAVFELVDNGRTLRLRGQAGLELSPDTRIELQGARSFAAAFYSRDPVVALRTASEVGAPLASADPTDRAHLLPIVNGERVVAVVFASDEEYVDVNALELVAGVASMVLERGRNRGAHLQVSAAAASGGGERVRPDWADLPEAERSQHLAAQRFARVTVAEWQLAKPEVCQAGRASSNLYLHLRNEIESARETFQKRFMDTPSMVDYLHVELVKTAAAGDAAKLGAEYPGPLG